MRHTRDLKFAFSIGLWFFAAALLLAFFGVVADGSAKDPVVGARGVVASAHPLATQAGMRILMRGGNAVDAAVATAAAIAVVQPESSGVGGVGLMLIYLGRTGELKVLDYRGTIPYEAKIASMNEETKEEGIFASCVPGSPAGWAAALEKYGTMSLADVLQPAIEYAENGFPVSHRESRTIKSSVEKLSRFPTTAKIFLPGGRAPEPGEPLVQKDLARTLKLIAANGPSVFYKGELADAFVKFSQEHGGFYTKRDFADYQPRWGEPISTTYRGYNVYCAPPPAVGSTILQLLNILEGYDLGKMGRYSADTIHLIAEAAKLASSDEMRYIGDPAFMRVPTERLISKEYASKQRARINLAKAAVKVEPGSLPADEGHTTAFTVADGNGNVVSVIQTHLSGFGSGVVFGQTGVLFNNNMRLVRANGPNRLEPGKRLRHPSVPIIVMKDGVPVLAIGAAGAATIWQTLAQVLVNVIDYHMNVQEALSSPRFTITYAYNVLKPGLRYDEDFAYGEVSLEEGFAQDVRKALEKKGHKITSVRSIGVAQGVSLDPKTRALMGAADPRGSGQAAAW